MDRGPPDLRSVAAIRFHPADLGLGASSAAKSHRLGAAFPARPRSARVDENRSSIVSMAPSIGRGTRQVEGSIEPQWASLTEAQSRPGFARIPTCDSCHRSAHALAFAARFSAKVWRVLGLSRKGRSALRTARSLQAFARSLGWKPKMDFLSDAPLRGGLRGSKSQAQLAGTPTRASRSF